jgi:hypothetical protein
MFLRNFPFRDHMCLFRSKERNSDHWPELISWEFNWPWRLTHLTRTGFGLENLFQSLTQLICLQRARACPLTKTCTGQFSKLQGTSLSLLYYPSGLVVLGWLQLGVSSGLPRQKDLRSVRDEILGGRWMPTCKQVIWVSWDGVILGKNEILGWHYS